MATSTLEAWKAASRSGDHVKAALLERRCLKGAMTVLVANV